MKTVRHLLLGVVIALAAAAVPLRAQGGPFTAQIENFWRLISTGGRTFTTVSATKISMGTGVADTTHPFNAQFSSTGNTQFLWWNNNAGVNASAELVVKSNDAVVALSPNSSTETYDTASQRGVVYSNCGGGGCTSGNPGLDFISCTGATPTLCFTRFATNSVSAVAGERARIDATGLKIASGHSITFTSGVGTAITATGTQLQFKAPDAGAYLIEQNGGVFVNSANLLFGTGGTPDGSLSRLGAASFSLGTSTQGDFTATLKLGTMNAVTAYQINGVAGATHAACSVAVTAITVTAGLITSITCT